MNDLNKIFNIGGDLNFINGDANFFSMINIFDLNVAIPQPKVLLDIPYVFEWTELGGKYFFNFTFQGFALITIIVFLVSYFAVDKTVDFIKKKLSLEKQEETK